MIESIRPALIAEGGDVRLVRMEGNDARVVLRGPFERSALSVMALRLGLERAIRQRVEGFGEVIAELRIEGEAPRFEEIHS